MLGRPATPEYSLKELEKHGPHNAKGIHWVGLFGKIYNASKFSNSHPGGANVLLHRSGDVVDDVLSDVNHRSLKKEKIETLMAPYKIGKFSQEALTDLAKKEEEAKKSSGCVIN